MNLLDLAVRIMCNDEASDKVGGIASNITKTMGGAAKTAAMAMGAAVTAIGGAVSAIGIQAINGYKEFEQLSGGVAKLFGTAGQSLEEYAASVGKTVDEASGEYAKLSQAEDLVMQNAANAWRTAQMDANTYMETATSFSAALINSLGGDTVKAAEMTDVAMRAISDNFNTFGGDMQNVMNAFQGFAKGQYNMLDNLRLGYSGTQAEMERLIADANEYAASIGMAADLSIDSFADVVQAIELIQEKQGIAGTAQKEALKTIEGSMNATRAAWSNFVTELGKDDADIEAVMGNLVTALTGENGEGGLLNNMSKRVAVIGENIAKALPTLVDTVVSAVPTIIAPIANALIGASSEIVSMFWDNLVESITSMAPSLTGGFDLINADLNLLQQRIERTNIFGDLLESAQEFASGLAGAFDVFSVIDSALWGVEQFIQAVDDAMESSSTIVEFASTLGLTFLDFVTNTTESLIAQAPLMFEAAAQFFGGFVQEIAEQGPTWIASVVENVSGIVTAIAEAAPALLAAAGTFIGSVLKTILEEGPKWITAILTAAIDLVAALIDSAPLLLEGAIEFLSGIVQAIQEATPEFLEGMQEMVRTLVETVVERGPDMLAAAIEFILNLATAIADSLPQALESLALLIGGIVGTVAGAASELLSAAVEFVQGFLDGSNEKYDDLRQWFADLPGKLVSAIGSVGTLLWDSGKSIVNGFIDGAKAAWEQTKGFFTGIAGWIADHKGPIEYDRKLLVGHGQAIMQGLQDGLSDGYKDVQRLVSGMADNISTTASASLSMPYTASQGKPPIQINLSYNAGEDATQLVDDIAARLVLLGYAEG